MSLYRKILTKLNDIFGPLDYLKMKSRSSDLILKELRNIPHLETIDIQAEPGFAEAKLYYGSTYENPKKMKFTIPIGNLSKVQDESKIKKLMSDYQSDINWNDYIPPPKAEYKRVYSEIDPYGEENWEEDVNDIPHSKDHWFQSGNGRYGDRVDILEGLVPTGSTLSYRK